MKRGSDSARDEAVALRVKITRSFKKDAHGSRRKGDFVAAVGLAHGLLYADYDIDAFNADPIGVANVALELRELCGVDVGFRD
jgi:hypothetical protein